MFICFVTITMSTKPGSLKEVLHIKRIIYEGLATKQEQQLIIASLSNT